ncbi:MAG: Uma2 family endonuclease [Thermoanaerobaculia bacterium]|nr:Uma2 family endonuclease [Thermoanaerobaculia bacterium]
MDAATKPAEKTGRSGKRAIPAYLVREVIDGIPFYYRGYRQAMNKTKTLEELMSDSGLQFFLKLYLYDLLKARLNLKKYRVGAGELGFHPNYKNNMGLDVVVFDRKVLTPDKITAKFVEVPPRLVIEVDVNVELPERDSDLFQEYVVRKIRRLFASGTEKVIWIFTKSQQVFSATADAPWQVYDWDQDVELMEGVRVNLANYIREEGFQLP